MSNIEKKLPELEVFSGIAILCVVIIHSNSYYLRNILNLERYIDAGFFITLLDNFVHASVPMFIFIAGYKYALNNLESNYKNYAVKKINRTIRPFLVISITFFILKVVKDFNEFNSVKIIILEFIKIFIGYNVAYQLWYIPMYLFITLTYPIIYKYINNNKIRWFLIISIACIQGLLGYKFIEISKHPFDFVYYYLYFELGVFFYKYNIKNKIEKWDFKIIYIYIFMAIILAINIFSKYYSITQRYILWPLSVISYYKLCLILKNSRLLKYLGRYSFYIFLFHEPLICKGISMVIEKLGMYNSVFYVFIISILTIVISIILYQLIKDTFISNILFYRNKIKNNLSNDKNRIIKDI